MSTTVSAILSEWGAYYLNHGQNLTNLTKVLYRSQRKTEEMLFTRLTIDDTTYRTAQVISSEILQAFQTGFTPKGDSTFTPTTINLYKQKIDFEVTPDDITQSWLGFLEGNELDRRTWPLVRFLIEQHIMARKDQDYELNAIYFGSYVAPTAGTAGTAAQSMDGIKKIINAAITAGKITPIATGAPNATDTTWVGQVESFAAAVNKAYWSEPMILAMSEINALKFKRGMRLKYNMYYDQMTQPMMVADFPFQVEGFPSMQGSDKIWMTPKANAKCLTKKPALESVVSVESHSPRKVQIYSDWYKGVGFDIPQIVFTNDQDLT